MRSSSRFALLIVPGAIGAAMACGGVYSEEAPAPVEAGSTTPTTDAATLEDVVPLDGGAGDAATEASARFCGSIGTQQSTDIFCADFDGTDLREGFTGSAEAGLSTTTVTALSAPNALIATGPAGSTFPSRGPSLWWEKLGTPISVLDVTVGVNQPIPAGPPGAGNTGSIELLTMKTETTRTTFVFSRVAPGWFVDIEYVGSAAYAKREPVPVPLVEGKWTKVNLVYSFRTGTVTVTYDGVTVFNKPGHYTPEATLRDSKVTVGVGAEASGTTFIEPFRFDNLVARVTRE